MLNLMWKREEKNFFFALFYFFVKSDTYCRELAAVVSVRTDMMVTIWVSGLYFPTICTPNFCLTESRDLSLEGLEKFSNGKHKAMAKNLNNKKNEFLFGCDL